MIDRRSFLLLLIDSKPVLYHRVSRPSHGQKDTVNRHTQSPGFPPPPVRRADANVITPTRSMKTSINQLTSGWECCTVQ
jgi:hypothetical protein